MNDAAYETYREAIRHARAERYGGVVTDIVGLLIECSGPKVRMGEIRDTGAGRSGGLQGRPRAPHALRRLGRDRAGHGGGGHR